MFGKPEWFQEKRIGWGLKPVSWQGWTYSATWLAVIALPFFGLLIQGLVAEALIWMAATVSTVLWDVRSILREKKVDQVEDVLYIDEDESLSPTFASRKFNFRLRG
jgi:hypothetical protein